jgi:Response regulator receiver domain.
VALVRARDRVVVTARCWLRRKHQQEFSATRRYLLLAKLSFRHSKLTALDMPRLDGFQLIARIRREATLRGLPIVVLSSRTSQAARDRALAAGTNVLLRKSRQRRSLVAAVASCLLQREDGEPPAGECARG